MHNVYTITKWWGLCFVFLSISITQAWAQPYFTKPDSSFSYIQPSASIQMWSLYSMNERAQLVENGGLEHVDDRLSFMVRRARFGFKGNPYDGLQYTVTVQYDNLGKDKLSAARGNTNTGQLGILDVYASYRLSKNDAFWITAGYLQPQGSREAITGDMLVNSFDKSVSQGYVRNHINGKGYGRSTGVNVGGILKPKNEIFQVEYQLGIFGNNASGVSKFPESTGVIWSPLLSERVAISIGDPDKKKYALNYDANNFFSKRKGVTIGAYQTQQGKSDIFSSNYASGVDVLLNYASVNVDAEWNWLTRRVEGTHYSAQTGHVRLGYNIVLLKKYFIEPTVSWVTYKGDNGGQFAGQDDVLDVGINWYINKKYCKMALHYVMQDGHGNNTYTDGKTFAKGDFVGMAFIVLM